MKPNAGVKKASAEFEQSVAKQAHLAQMKKAFAGETCFTGEELREQQLGLKAACMARNPDWGWSS